MTSLHVLRIALAAALALAAGQAAAHGYELGDIHIGHPWARPTLPGQPVGGGYLKLDNRGAAADRLLGASADGVAARVEVHEMQMQGETMRMRRVDGIALPAGKRVALEPGGLHLMLLELKAPLAEGATFPLKLKFERAGEVTVEVKVEQPKTGAGAAPAASAASDAGRHLH